MRLVFSRAAPSDFDQLVPLAFRSFAGDAMLPVFFGHESPSSYAHVKREWIKGTHEQTDIWFKVEDLDAVADVDLRDDAGEGEGKERKTKIVGASNWKINATYVPPKEGEPAGPSLEDLSYLHAEQEREDAQQILTDYMTRRRRDCQEPHIFCSLLFVDPDYQRQGLGTILMQWGNDVADTMMLPCWLESSSKGEGLYRKMGYEDTYRAKWETLSFPGTGVLRMRRERKVEKWQIEKKTIKKLL
jgi:GNAT superfamily N-acetyltransferase